MHPAGSGISDLVSAVDLTAQIESDDVGALFGEPNRIRAPLTAGGSHIDSDLPVELRCHNSSSRAD
jgi:hypothetical protein